jgi:hypothetical protein
MMKKVKSLARGSKIGSIIVCAVIIALAGGLFFFAKAASPTPEEAVKKYILLKGDFSRPKDLSVTSTAIEDRNYGHQFIVSGYRDSETGTEVRFFYLKQNTNGWYVVSAGTGP